MASPLKDISDQELVAHVNKVNPWWRTPDHPIPRISSFRPRPFLDLLHRLVARLEIRRAVVLMGPRRVGKTILLFHLVERLIRDGIDPRRIGYLDVEHPILHYKSLESLIDLLEAEAPSATGEPRYVILDEIQYLKDWERHLKPLVDTRPELRLVVSGSAAAALKRSSTESGAGRFTDFLLPPLTFPEYLLLSDRDSLIKRRDTGSFVIPDQGELNRSFVDYLNIGGYPELALSKEIQSDTDRFIKSDIIDKVLLRDLPNLYGISDIQELNQLFISLAYNTAQEVSLEALAQKGNVAKPTLGRYIEYLEAAFLIRRMERVDRAGRRFQRRRQFKVFLTNPSMRSALFGTLQPGQEGFGSLAETGVVAQLFYTDQRLAYANWGKGEVDLVLLKPDLSVQAAIEVKWTNQAVTQAGLTKGLVEFCRSNTICSALCTTVDKRTRVTRSDCRIEFLPAAVLGYLLGLVALRQAGLESLNEPQ
jgi:predicted AAA+ superfamily ATPase